MKELLEILEAHRVLVSGLDCKCGWNADYALDTDPLEHQAEMLKPLLAKVWIAGFSGGFELAADDIGAWDVLTDHGVTLADYGLTNPYKEETE